MIRNVHVGINEPRQEGATSSINDLRIRDFQFGITDLFDLATIYQHAAMFQHVLTIKDPNVADQLSVDRCLAKGSQCRQPGSHNEHSRFRTHLGVDPGTLDDCVRIWLAMVSQRPNRPLELTTGQ